MVEVEDGGGRGGEEENEDGWTISSVLGWTRGAGCDSMRFGSDSEW
jgi:hypothetical protein